MGDLIAELAALRAEANSLHVEPVAAPTQLHATTPPHKEEVWLMRNLSLDAGYIAIAFVLVAWLWSGKTRPRKSAAALEPATALSAEQTAPERLVDAPPSDGISTEDEVT